MVLSVLLPSLFAENLWPYLAFKCISYLGYIGLSSLHLFVCAVVFLYLAGFYIIYCLLEICFVDIFQ